MIPSSRQEERFASACRRTRPSFFLVLLSLWHSTDALIVPSSKRSFKLATTRRTWTSSSSTASMSSANPVASLARSELRAELENSFSVTAEDSMLPKGAPVDRFHTDMRRVLVSRGYLASQSSSISSQSLNGDSSSMERRERPPVLGSDIDGAERVATMLQHMVQVGLATEESYQIVLKAFCDRGRVRWRRSDSRIVCAADEAEILMEALWPSSSSSSSSDEPGNSSGGTIGKPPSVETCNLAIQAYAMCATPRGNRCYATRAQELLERMDASGVQTNEQTLALLVQAWAWQQANMESEDCVKRARQNLDRLIQLNPDKHVLLHAYHLVLEATSKSASNGSAQAAHALLEKMKKLRLGLEADGDDGALLPNAQSYANAILAWCKCQEPGAAQKANDLLMEGIRLYENGEFPKEGSEPELIAFNGVISAWARTGFPDKAEEVLWKLDELQSKCPNLSPDVMTYNSVLHAHVRNPSKTVALERVAAMVKFMEQHQEEQPSIKPDSFTYNTLMKAWIYSGRPDAAKHAEEILEKMQRLWQAGDKSVQPTNRHYNVVLNALAKSDDDLRARKAYKMLQQMQASDFVQPDIITYTSVIECLSKSSSSDPQAAETAQELLQQAFGMYEETKDVNLMPNLRTFTMVILTLSKSPGSENVGKARALLTQLLDLYEETKDESLRPNAYPFNYVLNCAANCLGTPKEKIQAFQIASQTYQQVRKSDLVKPDSFTYAFWFKCCNNLLPMGDLRIKCLSYAFEQCKLDGLVNKEVLMRLSHGIAASVLATMLDMPPNTSHIDFRRLQVDDFSPDWSRNTRRVR